MPRAVRFGHKRHAIDILAEINGFATGLALYPQVFKSLRYDGALQLSTVSFALIFINSVVWTLYGFHRRLLPLIIASILNGVAALILVLLGMGR